MVNMTPATKEGIKHLKTLDGGYQCYKDMIKIVESEFKYETTFSGAVVTSIPDIAYLLMIVIARSNESNKETN